MRLKNMLLGLALLLAGPSFTQVDLIEKVKDNQSENAMEGFQWTPVVDVERLAVENQGASGTCWSYSTNSFLESEMARMGKEPVDLSEMFIVRTTYEDKADRYVRMHGNLNFGQGGALPVVEAEQFFLDAHEHIASARGDRRLVTMLVHGDWNTEEFLIVPSGHKIRQTGTESVVEIAPA